MFRLVCAVAVLLYLVDVNHAVKVTLPETVLQSASDVKQRTDATVDILVSDMMMSVAKYKAAAVLNLVDPTSVCFAELGCFSRVGNFSNFALLPDSPDVLKTGFLLFTAGDQVQAVVLNYSNPDSVSASDYRAGQPTFVVIHGFGESAASPWISDFQQAIFVQFPTANYIAVDWKIGAAQPEYWRAAANTQLVGAQVAKLLTVINEVKGTPMSQIHLIGFSLGAQVSGLTSNKLNEFGFTRVGRITGLDPAGPLFENASPMARLDPDDADFVQAVHSNGASAAQGAFGIARRVAHRDFYANGGQFQPGCPRGLLGSVVDTLEHLTSAKATIVCNHYRAVEYALESIQNLIPVCRFAGFPCASYDKFLTGACLSGSTDLDIFASKSVSRDPLYFITNSQSTYCTYGLRLTASVTQNSPSGKGSLVFKLPNSATTPVYTVLTETNFVPGKVFEEVIFGRLTLDDFQGAAFNYQRSCKIFCGKNNGPSFSSVIVQDIVDGITVAV